MKIYILLAAILTLSCGVATLPQTVNKMQYVATSVPTQATTVSEMAVCGTTVGLNLRMSAGTDAEVITTLPDGKIVTLTGKVETPDTAKWYEVEFNYITGWVNSSYLCEV